MRAAPLIFPTCLMGRNWFEGKHMRHVFCFHPSLIELQRAGSVCVMKFALVICFHTLQPAACPQTAQSPHVLLRDSSALVRRRELHDEEQLMCRQHTPAVSTFAWLRAIYQARRRKWTPACQYFYTKHTFGSKPGRTGVFLIPRVLKQKVSYTIYFAWLFCWNLRWGFRFIWGEDSEELSSDGRPAVLLLWWTSPRALGEGENVWGHPARPLAAAAWPPLVKSQKPKTLSSHHLPQTLQPLCSAWMLHLQAHSSQARFSILSRISVHTENIVLCAKAALNKPRWPTLVEGTCTHTHVNGWHLTVVLQDFNGFHFGTIIISLSSFRRKRFDFSSILLHPWTIHHFQTAEDTTSFSWKHCLMPYSSKWWNAGLEEAAFRCKQKQDLVCSHVYVSVIITSMHYFAVQ